MTYLYGIGRYGYQFSGWSPVIWYVQDDFGNLIQLRSK